MKILTTLLISIIALPSTAKDNNNLVITSAAVTTTSLEAGSNSKTVILNWSAKNYISKTRFEIERSFYSNIFSTIGTIQTVIATSGNFSIADNAAELAGRKIAYYRVKQIDTNGNVTYSNTTVVNLNAAAQTSTVKRNISVSFTAAQNANAVITIKSITGKIAAVKNMIASRGSNLVEIENNNIPKGMYTAVISVNGIVIDTQKVIAE